MKLMFALLLISLLSFSHSVLAGPYYTSGTVTSYTSTSDGLMLMVSGGLPDNCAGSPYGWMLIPQANKTIIATTLLAILQNKTVSVYTASATAGNFCTVNQVQPSL